MQKNKIIKLLSFSIAIFVGCLVFGFEVLGRSRESDNHHGLYMLPIILPIFSLALALKVLARAENWAWKILALMVAIANIGLAAFAFLAFSLTSLQF